MTERTPQGTVLLVDDDEDVREMMSLHLERGGWAVVPAAGAEQALATLRAGLRPDVMLLDAMMPRMSGPELCRALAALPEAAGLPVVLVSGDPATEQRARELGLAGHLRKPFAASELLATVARHRRPR